MRVVARCSLFLVLLLVAFLPGCLVLGEKTCPSGVAEHRRQECSCFESKRIYRYPGQDLWKPRPGSWRYDPHYDC